MFFNRDLEGLTRKISPFILKRRKEDVARDLPEKIPAHEVLELTNEQRKLYRDIQNSGYELFKTYNIDSHQFYIYLGPVLHKLEYVCDHPSLVNNSEGGIRNRSNKFDRILDKIEEVVDNDERVVVFSKYKNSLGLLGRWMGNEGIRFERFDGDVSPKDRPRIIKSINDGKIDALLATLQTGGVGINLTGPNHVIHLNRWWNPQVENQATDRTHRIGQTKTVFVHTFLTENTIEEKIERKIMQKLDLYDEVIEPIISKGYSWTKEEIYEILTQKI
jgi:SNF2 family DNA or RNA helicase